MRPTHLACVCLLPLLSSHASAQAGEAEEHAAGAREPEAQATANQDANEDALGFGAAPPGAESARAQDALGFGAATPAAGSDGGDGSDGGGGDALGFGETGTDASSQDTEPFPLSLGGRYRLRSALWLDRLDRFDRRSLAQARNLLGLWARYSADFTCFGTPASLRIVAAGRIEHDAAYLLNRDAYDAPTIETYELALIGEESYVSLALGAFDAESGLLRATLGQGEVLGLVALNPRDLRDPGLTDPEDLFMPVLATRAGVTLGRQRIEVFVVHEAFFGLRAPPLGRLSPLRALLLRDPLAGPSLSQHLFRYRDIPSRFEIGSQQLLGHYRVSFDGLDLDLYGGTLLDALGFAPLPRPEDFATRDITLRNYHSRYTLLAHSGGFTAGDVLLRWELSAELSRPETLRRTDSPFLQLAMERHDQLGALLGITYFGLSNTNLGLELQRSLVLGNPERSRGRPYALLLPVERTQLAARFSHTFFEHLQLSLAAVVIGVLEWNAAMLVGQLDYALLDALHVVVGGIGYLTSAEFGPFYGFEHNQRAYAELRWDFTLL